MIFVIPLENAIPLFASAEPKAKSESVDDTNSTSAHVIELFGFIEIAFEKDNKASAVFPTLSRINALSPQAMITI